MAAVEIPQEATFLIVRSDWDENGQVIIALLAPHMSK